MKRKLECDSCQTDARSVNGRVDLTLVKQALSNQAKINDENMPGSNVLDTRRVRTELTDTFKMESKT